MRSILLYASKSGSNIDNQRFFSPLSHCLIRSTTVLLVEPLTRGKSTTALLIVTLTADSFASSSSNMSCCSGVGKYGGGSGFALRFLPLPLVTFLAGFFLRGATA